MRELNQNELNTIAGGDATISPMRAGILGKRLELWSASWVAQQHRETLSSRMPLQVQIWSQDR